MTPCANPASGGAPDITFPATPDQARAAIMHVVATLSENGLDADQLGEVELAVAEVVNNIVEHGYVGLPAGAIRISCENGPTGLRISVLDQGHCIPGGLPPGCPPDLDVPQSDLPEGGFGWLLIRTIATDLSYVRVGNQNRLDMHFPKRAQR